MNSRAKSSGIEALSTPSDAHDPEDLGQFLTMRMVRLFALMRRAGVLAQRRRFDLSETEWRIMTQVHRFRQLSLNRLAELLVQDRGQLSRAVKAMVERGLLSRQRKKGSPEIEIDLTPAGRDLYAQMVEFVIERDHQLTTGINPEELAAVSRVTEAMIERAEHILSEEMQQG